MIIKIWAQHTLLIFTFLFSYSITFAQTWKAYLAYYEPTEIEQAAGNMLYVLASNGLYSYNQNDHSLQTYDKTTVLSDCDIAHIAWCQKAKRLVIVYADQNIDLLEQNDNVINMADYRNKSMTDDKTINFIDINGSYAYLSTGFGIIQLNVADAEISNTFSLGFNVNYSYIEGNYLYAASAQEGLWRGLLTDNLLDKANWSRVGGYTTRTKTMDPDLLALVKTFTPGGPKYNNFGEIHFINNQLYTVGGGFTGAEELMRPGCIQVLKDNNWTFYEDSLEKTTGHAFIDLGTVTVDPTNINRVFAGGRTGLYEFQNSKYLQEFTPDNSPLRGAATVSATNKDYNIVNGSCFDSNGHLWVANSISATTNILEYDPDANAWTSHHRTEIMQDGRAWDNMCSMMFDSHGLLWVANNHFNNPAFACYQPSSDAVAVFKSPFTNEDGTTIALSNGVRSIAEDKSGNIWIGTDKGPLMLEAEQITATTPIFTQVKVPRNDGTDYADYLLTGVDIKSIIVDKNNRKWFGTSNNGLYLISSDNIHQLQHFTAENSPLLSDNIESLAINESTGEVFIGTDKGLCSYTNKSLPTGEGMTNDNVWAYPNPVRPDYRGAITIVGLDDDADVKIVTSNGTLVNQGRASGGEYKWYGIDQNSGKRVASGVYMVEVATATGEKGVVCKIAIVN